MTMSRLLRLFFVTGFALAILVSLTVAGYGYRQVGDVPTWGWVLMGIGLVGALVGLAGALLPLAAQVNLSLVLASTLVALLVGNWLLIEPNPYVEAPERRLEAAAAAGIEFDRRTPLEVVRDLRRQGVPAVPVHSPGAILLDQLRDDDAAQSAPFLPLAGISRTPAVMCNETGEYMVTETDRFGFNNPDVIYDLAPPLILIGDSFTFGYCLRQGESVASHLRARGYSLLNLGYPGSGPLIQLAQLREFGPVTEPEVVLWFYYSGNDITNLMDEYEHPLLRRYLDPDFSQGLRTRQDEVDAWQRRLITGLEESEGRQEGRSVLHRVLTMAPLRQRLGLTRTDLDEQPIDRVGRLAEAIRDEAARQGAELAFVYLPTYTDLSGLPNPMRERVIEAVEAAGVRVVDFEAVMRAQPDPFALFPFGLHGHYTGEGYRLLADLVFDEVLSRHDLIAGAADLPPAALHPVGVGVGRPAPSAAGSH